MKRLVALGLVLIVSAHVSAQDKRPPVFPDDFGSPSVTVLPYAISPACDQQFSHGLALRVLNGELLAYTACWKPQVLNVYAIPFDSVTGTYKAAAVFRKTYALPFLGLPTYDGVEVRGLYWDEIDQRLYVTGGHVYDLDMQVFPTLARLKLDDASTTVTVEGNWRFDRRAYPYTTSAITFVASSGKYIGSNGSDKMMMGGTLPVPDRIQQQYHLGRLAQGFGGMESGVTMGPASMGPALATFDPPVTGTGSTFVVAKSILGYPYRNSITAGIGRAPRDANFINDFAKTGQLCKGAIINTSGEDWPRTVSEPNGYWITGDWTWQSTAAIETANLSGVVVVANEAVGRFWYGVNGYCPDGSRDGSPAQTNAWGWKHVLYTYDWNELGAVAFGGVRQDQVKGRYQDFSFPGLTYPIGCKAPGDPVGCRNALPDRQFMVTGVAFEPTRALFAVEVWNVIGSSSRPRIAIWPVRDSTAPRLPVAPSSLKVVTS